MTLHWPETTTVPGGLVIPTVHMFLESCLHCFTTAFLPFYKKNTKKFISVRLLRKPSSFSFFMYHTVLERVTDRESEAANPAEIKPFSPPISLESQSILNYSQNRW